MSEELNQIPPLSPAQEKRAADLLLYMRATGEDSVSEVEFLHRIMPTIKKDPTYQDVATPDQIIKPIVRELTMYGLLSVSAENTGEKLEFRYRLSQDAKTLVDKYYKPNH